MDRERKKRQRLFKVIFIDILMAVSVLTIVIVLVALVAGWRVNGDLSLEQNGLIQIDTSPTGAKIFIDGEEQPSLSNMSKMLPGGEHSLKIEKEGFDSWEKNVKITPGWLLNVKYPRLFKENRERKTVAEFQEGLKFLKVAPDRRSIIFAETDQPKWQFVTDLSNDKIKITELDFSNILTTSSFNELKWSHDTSRVLVQNIEGDWLVLNLKKPSESINITKNLADFEGYSNIILDLETGAIEQIDFAGNSNTEFYIKLADKLVKIDISAKSVAELVKEKAKSFSVRGADILFETTPDEKDEKELRLIHDGDKDGILIKKFTKDAGDLKYVLGFFYGKKYIIYTVGERLFVYRADEYAHVSEMELMAENDLGLIPEKIELSTNLEFVVLRKNTEVVVYDTEVEGWTKYDFGVRNTDWLDNFMMYKVEDGKFIVWDFDGTNIRTIVPENAEKDFAATISTNDKYFYYVSKSDESLVLSREVLVK